MKVKIGKLDHSEYFWGDKSEIEGATLDVIDISVDGYCYLCVSEKGLVMVDIKDIDQVIMN